MAFIRKFIQGFRSSGRLKSTLEGMTFSDTTFSAIDLELTSLDPRITDITSVGHVSGENGTIALSSCGYCIVKTHAELGQSPVIHGLTQEVLNEGVELEVAIQSLLSLLQRSVLVFHNASLDLHALNKAFNALKLPPIDVVYFDTLKLALYALNKQHHVLPNNSATLAVCRQRLDLPIVPEHNALDDALATLQLFFAQLTQLGVTGNNKLSALLHTKSVGIYTLGVK